MKVLFLDIDGVLNSRRSCVAYNGYPHDFTANGLKMFDWTAVALVRKLCEECDVSVVLSSTWRMTSSVHEVANGLDLPVFDKTPVLHGARGFEINAWLSEHPEVATYAILDDNSDMLDSQKPFFVQTCEREGFSLINYADLKRIYGAPEPALVE